MSKNNKIITVVMSMCFGPCGVGVVVMFVLKSIALSYTYHKYKKSKKAITEVKHGIEDDDANDLEKSANK